ncbi:MAG: hypothetical protein Aureis2KO_27340 [Aureisphaera sp.]
MTETKLKVATNSPLDFLSYTFYPRKGSIVSDNGTELFMEPRLRDFFHVLLLHKDDVVTREELMGFVWKDTVVTEDSISKAASDLRKFLDTHDIGGVMIATIPKLGYSIRLLNPVENGNQFLSRKNILKFAIYSLVVFTVLILLIRALRYEQ